MHLTFLSLVAYSLLRVLVDTGEEGIITKDGDGLSSRESHLHGPRNGWAGRDDRETEHFPHPGSAHLMGRTPGQSCTEKSGAGLWNDICGDCDKGAFCMIQSDGPDKDRVVCIECSNQNSCRGCGKYETSST